MADYNNMDPTIDVTSTPTLRIHKIHPQNGCQKCNSYMATSHKIGNVKQPPGFEDPAHPNKVYIVVKALYGLHQAPRAWNERLSTFLLKHGYKRGAIDKTLSSMVIDFEDLMQKRIQDGGVNILEEDWFLAMQETNDYAISSTEAEYVGSSSFVPQTIRADLLFDDANGVDCFPKQVIGLTHRYWLRGSSHKSKVQFLLDVNEWDSRHIPMDYTLTPPMLSGHMNWQQRRKHRTTSPHSRAASSARDAQGTPTQSAAQASISTAQDTAGTQGTAQAQDTDEVQDTDPAQGATAIPKSPNDYTPTDASQTSRGDEGLLDLYALEQRKLRDSRGKPFLKLNRLSSSRPNSRNCPNSYKHMYSRRLNSRCCLEELFERKRCCYTDFERKSDETEALERKSDETKEINDLNFDDEAGPSSPIRPTQNIEPEEQFKVDEVLADISRPRGLSIPGPIQSQPQPQQPSQATDPKDKGKGILVEEPKKKKLTLKQIRALETTNDEEVQKEFKLNRMQKRKKRFEELNKSKPKTTFKETTSLAQE
ncbi:putative ribonuclease H-like domain-containing protein [Tanacetum coccineum]